MLGLLHRRNGVQVVDDANGKGVKKRFGWDDLWAQVNYLNHHYPLGLQTSMAGGPTEQVDHNFEGFAEIYRRSGPVFSCILARGALFSEARFQYQRFEKGRPGELYGSNKLKILEKPWPGGDTGEMLMRAEQDVSLAGNWYLHRLSPDRVRRLRPDWVSIVMGSETDHTDVAKAIDAQVIAYVYEPPGEPRQFLMPEDMVHWSPIPDPVANYKGMSWIPPALTDVQADKEATSHKLAFFENAATPNFVVLPDKDVPLEEFTDFRDDFVEHYEGSVNAHRTLFLGGGSDVRTLGLDFEKMDYSNVQGAGETRIAAAANVPPIVAGFSQGLEAATYSNYGQARRKFGDHFARPQWRSISSALSKFVEVAGDSRLWYDDRDIPFLREDLAEEAKIRQSDANTMKLLLDAGWEPDAAVQYVRTGNLGVLLGNHSGRISVQQHPLDPEEEGSVSDDPPDEGDEEDEDVEDVEE